MEFSKQRAGLGWAGQSKVALLTCLASRWGWPQLGSLARAPTDSLQHGGPEVV